MSKNDEMGNMQSRKKLFVYIQYVSCDLLMLKYFEILYNIYDILGRVSNFSKEYNKNIFLNGRKKCKTTSSRVVKSL